MRKFLVLCCFGLLASCELFMSTEEKTQEMVREELQGIDWNDVDQYPLFDECDETATKQIQRDCFQTVLLSYFSKALDSVEFEVASDLNDTIYVLFEVDEHGFILVKEVEENLKIINEVENFNATISKRLNDLTTVKYALKRGIPVSIRFRLPIVVNTK